MNIFKKIWGLFKKIPEAYYNWKKRNEQLQNFLNQCGNNKQQLETIGRNIDKVGSSVNHLAEHVNKIDKQIDNINNIMSTVSRGTKMELFDTLHTWREILVIQKKWASVAEKREVEEIYHIYHDELKGNGQGERYYIEIMALPESEDELKQKQGGN